MGFCQRLWARQARKAREVRSEMLKVKSKNMKGRNNDTGKRNLFHHRWAQINADKNPNISSELY